jgi:hypothetical protein
LSVLKQADVVGLLTVGSKAAPKEEVLKLGDAGNQQLVEIKETAEERGLAAFFQDNGKDAKAILGPDGLPPSPPNLNPSAAYTMVSCQNPSLPGSTKTNCLEVIRAGVSYNRNRGYLLVS